MSFSYLTRHDLSYLTAQLIKAADELKADRERLQILEQQKASISDKIVELRSLIENANMPGERLEQLKERLAQLDDKLANLNRG